MKPIRQSLISELQREISETQQLVALYYQKGYSNTTRTKNYKLGCKALLCPPFNQVIHVDREQKKVLVEPRVTMEALVRATLMHGLLPPVVPEFKGITVGGAIMGAAAESGSHRWGIFYDNCQRIQLIDGKGEIVSASTNQNRDLFYGISGSYGSLGMLIMAELDLIPVTDSVLLRYSHCDPHEAVDQIHASIGKIDFIDGLIFSPQHAVVIQGEMVAAKTSWKSSRWYTPHVKATEKNHEEILPLYDYLFRYDLGAFWMGALLFKLPFLSRYFFQGLCKKKAGRSFFTPKEIQFFKKISFPNELLQFLTSPLMQSQYLWALLHRAEKWIQDRLVIQDCSIPFPSAHPFLEHILTDPGIYPIWLCPLKGTMTPQFLAPHFGHSRLLNFGIYGVPAYSAPMQEITQKLEELTQSYQGRKVLYSRSFYPEKQFWEIYSKSLYDKLRLQTHSNGKWPGLIEKVLSE